MLEEFALRIELVDDGVGVRPLVVGEYGDLAKLAHFIEELAEIWALVDENLATVLLILYFKVRN